MWYRIRFWLLKKLVLFLKWFVKGFEEEMRILISSEPKKVILHNKSNITFLGDFIMFYNCRNMNNCHIFCTNEGFMYALDHFDPFYLYYQCNTIANCSHRFLVTPKGSVEEVRNDMIIACVDVSDDVKKSDRSLRKEWHRWLGERYPIAGCFSNCTVTTEVSDG